MTTLAWIVAGGVAMSAISLVGSATLLLKPGTFERLLMPLVAFAAGSLLGGAFLHMLPAAVELSGEPARVYLWTLAGFTAFLALEQLLHVHHSHQPEAGSRKPLTYLLLIGDSLHNFVAGVGIAGVFLVDVRLGIAAWVAAAAHEIPQELGDYAVLLHGGWSRRRALLVNFLSGLTFLVGGVAAWAASAAIDLSFLVPFAAGNFLYIAASDLVPEVNKHRELSAGAAHFAAFVAGIALLWAIRLALAH